MSAALQDEDKGVHNKASIDFVTATDKANEKLICTALQKEFPNHQFIGEEGSAESGVDNPTIANPAVRVWICDPVDGTTNFLHAFPYCCVSIGLHHLGRPVAGVVYDPFLNELYVAAEGMGSYCNGRRLLVSKAKRVSESMFLTEIGYQRDPDKLSEILAVMKRLLLRDAHSVRIMGSGVLDLCFVASGRLDFVYSGVACEGWKPWDHCAGAVILTEAGGKLTNIKGQPFDVFGDSVVAAATEDLLREVVQVINSDETEEKQRKK